MNANTLKNLIQLTDDALESALAACAGEERRAIARSVAHLAEVSRRKLHLKRGYTSLYMYARGELKYAEASAFRRTSAAQLALEHVGILEGLASGALSLCTLAEVSREFRKHEQEVRHAARQDSLVVAPVQPELIPAISTSTVEVPRAVEALTKSQKTEILHAIAGQSKAEALRTVRENLGPALNDARTPARPRGQKIPLSRNFTELRITLTPEQLVKYEKLEALLSRKVPDRDPNAIFDLLLDEALEKHDPERKLRRVAEKKRNETPGPAAPSAVPPDFRGGSKNDSRLKPHSPRSRHIPEPIRREVCVRDRGQCQFKDTKTGKICGATRFLDIDHVHEFSSGGVHSVENTRLMCANHNRNRRWVE